MKTPTEFYPLKLDEIQFISFIPHDQTKPTELHMVLKIDHPGLADLIPAFALRIKSRARADEIIEHLIEHRNLIWGDEPPSEAEYHKMVFD